MEPSEEGGEIEPCPGWLVTSVAPWGENAEDAFDQALVELGLGDSRLVEMQGAMLPLGFDPVPPRALPLGSLVEVHLAKATSFDGGTAAVGIAWARCRTPEGDECAIVASISTAFDSDETEVLLKRALQRRLASRDLEVISYDFAIDEVTAGPEHHGVVLASLILPETLKLQQVTVTGPVRETKGKVSGGITREVEGSGFEMDIGISKAKSSGSGVREMTDENRMSFDL